MQLKTKSKYHRVLTWTEKLNYGYPVRNLEHQILNSFIYNTNQQPYQQHQYYYTDSFRTTSFLDMYQSVLQAHFSEYSVNFDPIETISDISFNKSKITMSRYQIGESNSKQKHSNRYQFTFLSMNSCKELKIHHLTNYHSNIDI